MRWRIVEDSIRQPVRKSVEECVAEAQVFAAR
jgi:hypothetical protein